MEHNRTLGLLRLTEYRHQEEVVSNLSLALEDLYDSIDSTRESTRELEDVINGILYGEGIERSSHRSLRTKLLDPKGNC